MTAFTIETSVFQGPLDVLLDLIEKRKLLINDVSLASVADEYMDYINRNQDKILSETTQFVAIASTLLLIKSKSLLPVLELTDEEEKSIEDLEYRLTLYKLFRHAGTTIGKEFGNAPQFSKTYKQRQEPIFMPDSYVEKEKLYTSMKEVIHNLPKKIFKKNVSVKKLVSLEDTMKDLHSRVSNTFKMSFSQFSGNEDKSKVIVSFLAVLELVKQGMLMARQQQRFADFELEKESLETPNYG